MEIRRKSMIAQRELTEFQDAIKGVKILLIGLLKIGDLFFNQHQKILLILLKS